MLVSGRARVKKKTSLKIPKEFKTAVSTRKTGRVWGTFASDSGNILPCSSKLLKHRAGNGLWHIDSSFKAANLSSSLRWCFQTVETGKKQLVMSPPRKSEGFRPFQKKTANLDTHMFLCFFSRELNRVLFGHLPMGPKYLNGYFDGDLHLEVYSLQEEGYQGRRPFFCRGSTSAGFCNVGAGGNTTRQMRWVEDFVLNFQLVLFW